MKAVQNVESRGVVLLHRRWYTLLMGANQRNLDSLSKRAVWSMAGVVLLAYVVSLDLK